METKRTWVGMVLLGVWFVLAGMCWGAEYGGGSGTADDPYQIATVADWQVLMATSADWTKSFILTADLDLQGITLSPVGNTTTKFTGSFNGNGHIIRNATINTPSSDFVGLFGYINPGGQVYNLGIESAAITGHSCVGGLVGVSYGTINTCYATGAITGSYATVGGLVGGNAGIISNCYATGAVTGIGISNVGGLIGWNSSGTVSNCYATGTITGSVNVGGLIGYNESGTVSNCYATGIVTVPGLPPYPYPDMGGLIGSKTLGATVNNCFWDTQTSGWTTSHGGTGKTTAQMQDINTFLYAGWDFVFETANGTQDIWTISSGQYPRLAWQAGTPPDTVTVPDVVSLTQANAENAIITAGLTLWITHGYSDTVAAGTVISQSPTAGIILLAGMPVNIVVSLGSNSPGAGTVENPYKIGTIANWQALMTTSANWNKYFILIADLDLRNVTLTPVGNSTTKFIGSFNGNGHIIRNATINTPSNDYVGLFGYINTGGQVYNLGIESAAITGHSCVGGLVGVSYGTINTCYTTGAITGSYMLVGGLAGSSYGTINACYATGTVTGSYVGGLVGGNAGTVSNCYATGSVSDDLFAGGLIGDNYGTVSNCFWDTQTSGKINSDGGTGKTTAQMKTLSTFTSAGWDFSTTDGDPADWCMPSPPDYPKLAWQKNTVGLNEFSLLSQYWLMSGCIDAQPCAAADWYEDGTIDILDLDVLVDYWLSSYLEKQYPPLAAHWPMDESSGSVVSDTAGLHHGQLVNMNSNTCWTAGHIGNALQFDGINDYVQITGYKGILGSHARTCAAWIKATSSGQSQIAIAWGGPDPAQTWYFGGIFTAPNTTELAIGIGNSSYIKCSATPFDDQWHHIAVVLSDDGSPTTSEIKLYLDGQLRTETTIINGTAAINTSGTHDVYLGAYTGSSAPAMFFKGLLDEVRIYNYALSDAEIAALAQ